MRRTIVLLVITSLALPGLGASASRSHGSKKPPTRRVVTPLRTPLQSMVAAEQEFAHMSNTQGTRAAFLANLAEDAVIFRPLPINGHESWESRPPSKGSLAWAPAYAEIAASGDLGVTSGPWEYRPPAEQVGAEVGYGDFLTVWRLGKDGWKVALDYGVSHPRPEIVLGGAPFTAGPEHPTGAAAADAPEPDVLLSAELAMSRMVSTLNAIRAVAYWTAGDLRYLHEGDLTRTGDDARNAMSTAAKRPSWKPTGNEIARSGDLGYTYGVREDLSEDAGQAPDSSVYVHIWRREPRGQWRICAAVENPLHAN